MKVGDRIRVIQYMMGCKVGTEDFTVEEFRYCLGIFEDEDRRKAQIFTPLCEIYEPGPSSKRDYISNFGKYNTEYVQAWCDIPKK